MCNGGHCDRSAGGFELTVDVLMITEWSITISDGNLMTKAKIVEEWRQWAADTHWLPQAS